MSRVSDGKEGMFQELTTSAMKFDIQHGACALPTSLKIEISASCFLFGDVDI